MYALYTRQSRDKKDSVSIESQFNFCMKEVPEGTQIKKYKDKGFSGKNVDRPDFQKLLKDIKRGNVKRVIVYRLDRMSRSLLDFAELMNYFNKYNVDFVSATEKFDTSTPIGKAMLSIIMVFAELERETIQQRITDSYYARAKLGMSLGGNTPYGFELTPTTIEGKKTKKLSSSKDINHAIELFNKYATTKTSLKSLAFCLNKNEIKTKLDNYWDSAKISRLLKNPAYVKADIDIYEYFKSRGCIMHNSITEYDGKNGLYTYGNKMPSSMKYSNLEGYNVVIAPHEGVVDSKTWLKCQSKLSKNKKAKNSGKSKYSWLSGLTKCMSCGYSMNINKATLSKKNNTEAVYFRCAGKANKGICNSLSTRVEIIEELVKNDMFEHVQNLSNNLKIESVKDSKIVDEIRMQIASKENEIENLVDNLASAKGAAMKYVNKRIEKLDAELNLLSEELRKANQDNDLDDEKIIQFMELLPIWDEMELEDKKDFAQALIDKVYIQNIDDKIDYKIAFKY